MPSGSRQPKWPALLGAGASILLFVHGCASRQHITNYCQLGDQQCRTSSWLDSSQKSQASSDKSEARISRSIDEQTGATGGRMRPMASMPSTGGSLLSETQTPVPQTRRPAAGLSRMPSGPLPVAPVDGNPDVGSVGLNNLDSGMTVTANRSQRIEVTSPSEAPRKVSARQQPAWLKSSSLTLGTRVWFSQGHLGYDFGAFGGPDVTSELLWKGQNTKVYEVKADLVVRRFVSNLTLGWGSVGHGTLQDLDFEGNGRTGIFSDTLSSPTDGFIVYGSVDIGPRLIRWTYKGEPGAVDVLVGFQYWQEKYTARGVDVLLCNSIPGFTCALPTGGTSNANAITETITWKSIRLGPRVTVPVLSRLTAVGQAFYIPWNHYENIDIHHLRTDLPQDPSFKDIASGGQGIQLEGALQLRVWRSLRIEAGYRYWDVRSGSGTSCVGDCLQVIGVLNDAKARRQGLFFGVDWRF
jgi:hypothetical protein